MSEREDRLRSLLDRIRAKRPAERETHAGEMLERLRTASGSVPAASSRHSSNAPAPIESAPAAPEPAGPTAVPAPVEPTPGPEAVGSMAMPTSMESPQTPAPVELPTASPPVVAPPLPDVDATVPTQGPTAPTPPPQDSPTSPIIESPTRYSSQPPRVERPLSAEPRPKPVKPDFGPAVPPASVPSPPPPVAPSPPRAARPESVRPQSVAPSGQPIVYASEAPEFPRPKSFGDLLELTLSLRPR